MKISRVSKMLFITMPVAVCLFVAACQKNVADKQNGSQSVSIYLTDDPSLVLDNVLIDIRKLEIKAEDSSSLSDDHGGHGGSSDDDDNRGSTKGGWMELSIRPGVYDVLKFRNGLDTLLASGTVPAKRTLRKVRLTLGANNSVVLNGKTFPLTVKDNDNIIVIKIDEILSGDKISFWLDFDAGRSVRQHGNVFELKPEVKGFRKEKAGSIEGRVLPTAANAIVYAINGTDTASAKPEREGEFKIVGLKAGSYSLWVHATASNYKDTTIKSVVVREKEDAHTGTITLRQ